MVGRFVLLLIFLLGLGTGLPAGVHVAVAPSEARAQTEVAKPLAVAQSESEPARSPTRVRSGVAPLRAIALRRLWQPFRISAPSALLEHEPPRRSAALSHRPSARSTDLRSGVRRMRAASHIPRMDDDPVAA